MSLLAELAEAAGVAVQWKDYRGASHDVEPDTLRSVLAAIGLPAGSEAEIEDSLGAARAQAADAPLVTAVVGEAPSLPGTGRFRLHLERGGVVEGEGALGAVDEPGYHRFEQGGREITLAVAPRACAGLPRPRCWGIAVQLYSLRRKGDGGIGDFGGLRAFVRAAGAHGADGVAISPIHAQFAADPDRFSPYAPSSRIMLNVLHAETKRGSAALEAADLVDWPTAARVRLKQFRARFDADADAGDFAEFRRAMGEPLEAHARFETLHAHFFRADPERWHWRSWPEAYHSPASPAVAAFAREHEREVAFHTYLQFLADRGWESAQRAARDAGMAIGLISDLAVGTDGGGSHGWSRQDETLIGLAIGAPPDLLNTGGQNWGITAFSPRGLRLHGFGAFIEMLRANLRHAGGVRIDHVMGLQRLWVVPDGASSAEGAYLALPVRDLMRLTALESQRHGAIVLGEDLGTVPDGFQEQLIGAGLLGMRVLWFEQHDDRSFRPPQYWSRQAVAMSTTHDLPTIAGWWNGADIGWRHKIGLLADEAAVAAEQQQRQGDRERLWHAMTASGAGQGAMPGPGETPRAIDAAVAHVGGAACDFALLPIEDALGREEQPNLPGTLDEHPNWRRRLPGPAASLLDPPEVAGRLAAFAATRSKN